MPAFRYTAKTQTGATISGEMEAASAAAVIAGLQAAGHFPLKAVPVTPSLLPALRRLMIWRRISQHALVVTTHELATLLMAGLPLDRALDLAIGLAPDRRLAAAFTAVRNRVRSGAGLAQALEASPEHFSKLYITLVRSGESSGGLETALVRLSDYLERAQMIREQIKSALVYPIILLATAGLSLSFILTEVLPQFKPLFAEAGSALPLSTQIVMMAGDFVANWGWLVLISLFAGVIGLQRARADKGMRLRMDRWVLRLPVLGTLISLQETARFSRIVGTLVKGGVALPTALALACDVLDNTAMADVARRAASSLREGESLGALLGRSRLFPALAAQLVRVGEETGRLDDMLIHQAGLFERNAARTTERLLSALVPGLTIVLGGMVAGIVSAVLAAITRVNDLAS